MGAPFFCHRGAAGPGAATYASPWAAVASGQALELRRGEPLSAKDKLIHGQSLVSVLKTLHDERDAAGAPERRQAA